MQYSISSIKKITSEIIKRRIETLLSENANPYKQVEVQYFKTEKIVLILEYVVER